MMNCRNFKNLKKNAQTKIFTDEKRDRKSKSNCVKEIDRPVILLYCQKRRIFTLRAKVILRKKL